MVCLALTVIYFFFYSLYYFYWGMNLYSDLPNSKSKKLPESTLIYSLYFVCFIANLICVSILIYIFCYLAGMTYQMRGVLFADDLNQSQVSNLRAKR
mmetsp:Transcript_12548/g.16089  ORF Transcript_12548/g.16089 Transcript_12548/m.16089 type:complete len:97 (+) Transcript_12548:271-561(+)